MSRNVRHGVFLVLGITAFFVTWPFAFEWMRAGGNIFNVIDFFGDAIAPGGTAAFLSLDILFVWLTYMIWVVFDAKRIGLGYKWGIFFVLFSYVGVSLAFPVYLIVRERFVDRKRGGDEAPSRSAANA